MTKQPQMQNDGSIIPVSDETQEDDAAPKAVVTGVQDGFARPRVTPLDEHEQKDGAPIVTRHESGYTRLRTAPADAHEQRGEEPIVARQGSAYTRARTESFAGGLSGVSGEELNFSTSINQIASKPPRRPR